MLTDSDAAAREWRQGVAKRDEGCSIRPDHLHHLTRHIECPLPQSPPGLRERQIEHALVRVATRSSHVP